MFIIEISKMTSNNSQQSRKKTALLEASLNCLTLTIALVYDIREKIELCDSVCS